MENKRVKKKADRVSDSILGIQTPFRRWEQDNQKTAKITRVMMMMVIRMMGKWVLIGITWIMRVMASMRMIMALE